MSPDLHELIHDGELADGSKLSIPRARKLAAAAKRHRDYTVLRLLQRGRADGSRVELIIVEARADGVPSQNAAGIGYREILALEVPDDPHQLVHVLTLRKSFPQLMHQNQTLPGQPRDLCLYFEPARAVLRTWTPEKFLRRIQWWLEMSAQGELHAADQPAEQLFFDTKYELVLPWNLDKLREDPKQRFVLANAIRRPDGGVTYFLEPVQNETGPASTVLIEITLPSVVHGQVVNEPGTLGELADLLSSHAVPLQPLIQEALRQRVGSQGQTAEEGGNLTLLLLHIPITKTEGGSPARTQRRSYVIKGSANKLGVAVGALFLHGQKFFSSTGIIGGNETQEWKGEPLLPAGILYRNTAADARKQSGVDDAGPRGVLVGAGSLGSLLLAFWGRSGWGSWTVIDDDHIKPHNLSRHLAFACNIGQMKAHVAKNFHDATMEGASELTSICADATDFSKAEVREAVETAKFVVDASTTLEYPRLISTRDSVGRHASVFLTPNGNGAVMLVEDAQRQTRLRTLEAQYYRAVIREEWGKDHLEGNLGTFWSGASCRDISVVMPYARIAAHAGTLAEQVHLASLEPAAAIRVWQRDEKTGAVAMHEVQPQTERILQLDDLQLYMDASVERRLHEFRRASLPNETGGILLGYHDFNINAIVIVDALPAPPDSKASPAAFERGIAGLSEVVQAASKRTANIVGYVGEWHSHPPSYSTSPSKDDLVQLVHLAAGMSEDGLPVVQIIVGDADIHVLHGALR